MLVGYTAIEVEEASSLCVSFVVAKILTYSTEKACGSFSNADKFSASCSSLTYSRVRRLIKSPSFSSSQGLFDGTLDTIALILNEGIKSSGIKNRAEP